MKKRFPLAAFLAFLGFSAGARAAVLLTLTPVSASAAPGGQVSFDVYLQITGSEQVTGYDFYFQAVGTGYAGNFSILQRTSNLTDFSELNTSDADVATWPDSRLNPENTLSLGGLVSDPFSPVSGAGNYLLASYAIAIDGTAPLGVYTIQPVYVYWFDENFDTLDFDTLGEVAVTVVPEPSTAVLLAGTALMGCFFRRRRRESA